MRCEWPELTKCCFCIPLRKGLLAWGYLKLAFTLLMLLNISSNIIWLLYNSYHSSPLSYAVLISVLVINVIDVVFQIIFIISAHRKNPRHMRWYGHYNLVLVCAVIVISICYICFLIIQLQAYIMFFFFIPWVAPTILFLVVHVCLHVYCLILTRSEVMKLSNNTQFEFVNRQQEERCIVVMDAKPMA